MIRGRRLGLRRRAHRAAAGGLRARPGRHGRAGARRSAWRSPAPTATDGRNPLFALEVGAITEGEFLATLERELEADPRPRRSSCTASASATWARSTANDALFAYYRALHARGVRLALLHEQRARVGAAVARQAPDRRDLRDRRRLRRSSACASRTRRSTRSCSSGWGCPRRRACSSTTSRSTSRPRAALGFAGVHFASTEQAIAELDALLAVSAQRRHGSRGSRAAPPDGAAPASQLSEPSRSQQ